MPKTEHFFKRYETKYLINVTQYDSLIEQIRDELRPDEFGKSTICNTYYDTENYEFIRNSMDKPVYKEKLRIRAYNLPNDYSKAFIEIKKKYKGVGYKRRVGMEYKNAISYMAGEFTPNPSQIQREIDWFKKINKGLKPTADIFYNREAFFALKHSGLRITFDRNIMYRTYDFNFKSGVYGDLLIDRDYILMEIKTPDVIPLWLTKNMSNLRIYPVSFSKYARVYQKILRSDENVHIYNLQSN